MGNSSDGNEKKRSEYVYTHDKSVISYTKLIMEYVRLALR